MATNPYGPQTGLLGLLGAGQNPIYRSLKDGGLLDSLAYGLASGTGLADGLQKAALAQIGGRNDREERALKAAEWDQTQQQQNATRELLAREAPDLAQLLDTGVPMGEVWGEYFRRKQPGAGSDYDARFAAGQQYGLEGDALNTFALTGSVPGTNKTNVTYGVTPIYGQDTTTGKTGMGVQGSDGSFKLVDTGNFQPLSPYDLNANKAAGTAFGKATGSAQFDIPAVKLSTDQTLAAIADVRANERGLDEQFSMGGLQQMTPAWPGSEKAKFQVANSRLTNRAFLEAREVLRGGGQITDFESRKAEGAITNIEDAMARGDKALYLKALDDFEQAVKDGYAKLQAQAGSMPGYGAPPPPSSGGGNATSTGVQWSIEP